MNTPDRSQIKNLLRAYLEQTIEARVNRFLEIDHRWIIGRHPFTKPCFEATELYRDGHFTACVLLARSLIENLLRFVAGRNLLNVEHTSPLPQQLCKLGLLSADALQAVLDVCLKVPSDFYLKNNAPFADSEPIAKQALLSLSLLESEIFACHRLHGRLVPKSPQYWDLEDGVFPLSFPERVPEQ